MLLRPGAVLEDPATGAAQRFCRYLRDSQLPHGGQFIIPQSKIGARIIIEVQLDSESIRRSVSGKRYRSCRQLSDYL